MKPEPVSTTVFDAGGEWARLRQCFTIWDAVRPKRSWSAGFSSRMASDRLSKLVDGSPARKAARILDGLDARELRRIRAAADVNLEQAQGAARVAVLSNITVFLGGIVLLNQLFPGLLADLWNSDDGEWRAAWRAGIVTGAMLFPVMFIWVASYAYAVVASARDLKHVVELHLAGMEDGRPSTPGPEGSPLDDLRSAQLSDI